MSNGFDFKKDDLHSVPTWVKLPLLDLYCLNSRAIGKITSTFGKPLSIDSPTLERSLLTYARVLVEVDASKELPNSVCVNLPNGTQYH